MDDHYRHGVFHRTVMARNRGPIFLIAREVDGIGRWHAGGFRRVGMIDLSVEAFQASTKISYPNAEYDAELNLRRSTNKRHRYHSSIRRTSSPSPSTTADSRSDRSQ